MRAIGGIIFLVYLAAGAVIANDHHYFANLHDVSSVVSAILAVVLWPLILLGVDLHIGGGKAGRRGAAGVVACVGAPGSVAAWVAVRRRPGTASRRGSVGTNESAPVHRPGPLAGTRRSGGDAFVKSAS